MPCGTLHRPGRRKRTQVQAAVWALCLDLSPRGWASGAEGVGTPPTTFFLFKHLYRCAETAHVGKACSGFTHS